MLLSLDPGVQGLSPTVFENGLYHVGTVFPLPRGSLAQQCEYAREVVRTFVPGTITEVVCEEMVYYPQAGSSKASSEIAALLKLQAIGDFVAGSFNCPFFLLPARAWKSSLPKNVCHDRLRRVLFEDERSRLEEDAALVGKKAHNLYDSTGIGLYRLGRFRP